MTQADITLLDLIIYGAIVFLIVYAIPQMFFIIKETLANPPDPLDEEFLPETDNRRTRLGA